MKMSRIVVKAMHYFAFFLLVFVQGTRCQNCTRSNNKKDFCVTSCNPTQNNCSGDSLCFCDGDCGYSCVKPELHCPRPGNVNHGRVRIQNVTLGSIVKYRCRPGYKLDGSRRRVCRGNGDWDGKEPVCKALCADPGDIQHGTKRHDGFESGKQVKYSCNRGFTMQGSRTLTCSRSGRWDKVKPSCTCMRTNARAYRYCQEACDPKKNTCRGNKECLCDGDCGYSCFPRGLTCRKPEQIENGRRQYSTTKFWAAVKYQCNKPYSLLGSSTRTCRAIREWDGVKPQCKIVCEDPGDIQYGSKQLFPRNFQQGYLTVNDRVEYSCFPGYKMEGAKQLICNERGKWDNPQPTCTLRLCGPPPIPANAEIRNAPKGKTSFKYGFKVMLRCAVGYFARGMGLWTCNLTGWSTTSFSCSPKSCGHPGSPENGKIKSYVFTFKRKVHFECNYGYKLEGNQFRQCQANQEWSGRTPTCKPIDCGQLSTPDKTEKVWETHTRLDGVVKYKCKEKGYEIRGSEIRTCQNNGLWSGVATSCQIISCGNPGSPVNGKQVNVKNNYTFGGSVEFDCNENYTFAGSRQIICGESKDWSAPLPRCFAPCPDPEVPSNGSRVGNSFLSGSSVSFTCHEGFELEGDQTIACADGVWRGSRPHCKVISCGDPGTPLNGKRKKGSSYTYGGIIRFKCDTNFTLEGRSKIKCQANKKWTGNIPKCLAPCSNPGQLIHGIAIGNNFTHGSVVKFKCSTSFFVKGSTAIKCNAGQWNATRPTCEDCDEGSRIGGHSFWCSKNERKSFIEITLPKKHRITGATINVQDVKNSNIKFVELHAHIWHKMVRQPTEAQFNAGKSKIVPSKPFIAQKIQIHVIRPRKVTSVVCLTADVYGCDVPGDCLLPGSAVIFKDSDGYHRAYMGEVRDKGLEIIHPSKQKFYVSEESVVPDDIPNTGEVSEGTLVLVKDSYLTSDLITMKEGKVVQVQHPLYTVKTDDELTRVVNISDVRVVKRTKICSA